jgi:hypothetical protein
MRLFLARFSLWILFLVLAGVPVAASAATLYLDPDGGTYRPGDTFVVNVRLDANGECVNVVSADIAYPKDVLRAAAFSQGESILTLWTEAPKIDAENGRVSFIGGVPGGYCGRIAGDPGYANIVGKIIFTVSGTTRPGILPPIEVLPSSQVLLADGRGTPAQLLVNKATFSVASSSGQAVNEWLDELRDDTTPPESFSVDLHREENTVGGRYFVIFQTTDKQSGVAKYELIERDTKRPEFIHGERKPAVWRPVESPYVLQDQTLNSTIVVRAIDNAGQIREESLLPKPGEKTSGSGSMIPIIGGILVFVIAIIITIRVRRQDDRSSL